jgi:hypothetical protein
VLFLVGFFLLLGDHVRGREAEGPIELGPVPRHEDRVEPEDVGYEGDPAERLASLEPLT